MSNSPAIYAGKRTKLLTPQGPLLQSWQSLDYDGTFNCVTNSNGASGSIQNWNAYADAAAATPVDGTGGSPTVSISIDTTNVLTLGGSFHIQKDAANRQGEGVSIDINIPQFIVGNYNSVSFIVKSSAAFVAGDVGIYLYDRDSSTLITPSVVSMPASARGSVVLTQFTCPVATSGSYRLIFHVATANAAAWDLWIDRVYVGPGQLVQGPAVGGWTSYTPTIVGMGGGANAVLVNARYKRVTDHVEILGTVRIGTGGDAGSVIAWSMPSGLTAKIPGSPYNTYESVGRFSSTASVYGAVLSNQNANTLYFGNDAGSPLAANVTGAVIGNGNYLEFFASIPVNEFSVNQITGAEATEWVSWNSTGATTGSVVTGRNGGIAPTDTPSGTNEEFTITTGFVSKQDGDLYRLEFNSGNTAVGWMPNIDDAQIDRLRNDGTNYIGADVVTTAAGAILIRRGKYRTGTNTTWASLPANTRWRVRKVSAPALVGHNIATTSQPVGLLQTGAIPGDVSGAAAAAGYVGEYKEAVQSSGIAATSSSPGWGDIDPGVSSWGGTGATGLVLSAGEWDLQGVGRFSLAGSTTTTYMDLAIGTAVRSSTTGIDILRNEVVMNGSSQVLSNQGSFVLSTPVWRVKISSQTTYYLKANLVQSGGSVTVFGILSARRVR